MIYWINLDKSVDRKLYMETQFQKCNLENTRIKAIQVDDLPLIKFENSKRMTPVEFACLSSHFKALYEGCKNNDDWFVIMEDDIVIPQSINFEKIVNSAPSDWGILQLFIIHHEQINNLYTVYKSKNIKWYEWNDKNHSTGCYIITKKCAQNILSKFVKIQDDKITEIDLTNCQSLYMADYLLYYSNNTYTSTYPIVYNNIQFISTIHPDHFIHHFNSYNNCLKIYNELPFDHWNNLS